MRPHSGCNKVWCSLTQKGRKRERKMCYWHEQIREGGQQERKDREARGSHNYNLHPACVSVYVHMCVCIIYVTYINAHVCVCVYRQWLWNEGCGNCHPSRSLHMDTHGPHLFLFPLFSSTAITAKKVTQKKTHTHFAATDSTRHWGPNCCTASHWHQTHTAVDMQMNMCIQTQITVRRDTQSNRAVRGSSPKHQHS